MPSAPPPTPSGPGPRRALSKFDTFSRLAGAAAAACNTVDLLYVKPPNSEDFLDEASSEGITAPPSTPVAPGMTMSTTASAPPPAPVAAAAAPAARKDVAWVEATNAFISKNALRPHQHKQLLQLKFVAGVANIMLSAFLFAHPHAFILYYQVKAAVLLAARWLVYRLKGWHYYLLEFCYVAIAMGCVYLALAPTSAVLYKLTIALYVGVLTGAVVATRNAFVLHSCDKITSLFQHLSPALVAYLLRWHPERSVKGWASLSPGEQADMGRAGFAELTLLPMGVWLAWAATYYIGMFVIAEKTVQERGYATMFTLQTRNPKSPLSKWIFSFKTKPLQYAAYMAFHGGCCLVGCLLNNVWWHSKVAHSVLVLGVLGSSLWSGAAFYVKRVAMAEEQIAASRKQAAELKGK